jgi:hypothetical protein
LIQLKTVFFVIANAENKRKGINYDSHFPDDPEPNYEQSLEDNGATVKESVTHFPKSNTKLIKRSMTWDECRASSHW